MALRFRYESVDFGDFDIHVRTLRSKNEFEDDKGVSEEIGISPAMWPLFGVVWDSGHALAQLMHGFELDGKRILEVGCGIGLASLVLNRRNADITATDRHPKAEAFLKYNAALNGDDAIPFVRTSWDDDDDTLGRFDVIIGADLLYERGHPESLASFIEAHDKPTCNVILIDAGRGHDNRFCRHLQALGYEHERRDAKHANADGEPFSGRIHAFARTA